MAGDYTAEIALATELIDGSGELSTLVRETPGLESPSPWRPAAPTVTQIAVPVVWLNHSILRKEGPTNKKALYAIAAAAALGAVVPDPTTDKIRRANGTLYQIVKVSPLAPSGTPIIFEIEVE